MPIDRANRTTSDGDRQVRWHQGRQLWVAIAAVAIFTLVAIAPFLFDYGLSFVHPHRYENHIKELIFDTLRPQWSDVIATFRDAAGGEFRPRQLAYGIVLLDLKTRLAMYSYFVMHPVFSLSWVLQGLSVYLIYRLVIEFTANRPAAVLGALIYLTCTGFLSGITMLFMPGKPLSLVAFISAMLLARRSLHSAPPGTPLEKTPGNAKYWLLAIVFAGMMLDEVGLLIWALLPVVFLENFLPRPLNRAALTWENGRRVLSTALYWSIPFLAFLFYALVVAPLVTSYFLGFKFDYLATVFGYGADSSGAKSLLEGPYGGFSLASFFSNLVTFFGLSFVPWQISPLTAHPGAGGVITSQTIGFVELAILLPVLGGMIWLAWRSWGQRGRYFRRLIVASVLFVLLQSMLNGRHIPYISGYYYGSMFSVFIALLCAFTLDRLMWLNASMRFVAVGAALAVILIQVDNFYPLNHSYLYIHNERMARPTHAAEIPLAAEPREITATELSSIWRAWKANEMDSYIAAHPVSAGAVFLVVELRVLDRLRRKAD